MAITLLYEGATTTNTPRIDNDTDDYLNKKLRNDFIFKDYVVIFWVPIRKRNKFRKFLKRLTKVN